MAGSLPSLTERVAFCENDTMSYLNGGGDRKGRVGIGRLSQPQLQGGSK